MKPVRNGWKPLRMKITIRLDNVYLTLRHTLQGDAQEPGKEDVGKADQGSAPSSAGAGLE